MANKLKLKYVFDDKCQKDENIKILLQKMSRIMFQGNNCLFEKNPKFSTLKSSTLIIGYSILDCMGYSLNNIYYTRHGGKADITDTGITY